MNNNEIYIHTEYIKLDSALKLSGLCDTGGYAKELIQAGNVMVNDEVCTARGKKLRDGDKFSIEGQEYIVKQAE